MSDTKTMYPSGVRQPNRNQKNPISRWCFKEIRRKGDVYNLGCANPNDPRYYHEWSNAEEILYGREIQCGRPSTKHCSHATYYNIAGYRNTCPIAGCNGTYNQPATLQLEMSKSHLSNYDIIDGSEIHSVTINFKHKCVGIDVANGKQHTNWGPNFCGFSQYPDLKVLKMYITDSNGNIKGNTVIHNNNPPLGAYEGVSATFNGVTYNDISNGFINIVYQRNLSTNPGNIYIKDFTISINYTNAFPYITGTSNTKEAFTSENIEKCATKIIHTIEVGYKNKTQKMPKSKWPIDLRNNITVYPPDKVSYTKRLINDEYNNKVEYTFQDRSGVIGDKAIIYSLTNIGGPSTFSSVIGTKSDTQYNLALTYKAKLHSTPNIKVPKTFIQNSVASESLTSLVVSGENICFNKMEIYADGIDTTPIYTITSYNANKTTNIIKDTDIIGFHNVVTQLSCGYHTLFFRIDEQDSSEIKQIVIQIVPMKHTFKVFVNPSDKKTYDDSSCANDEMETDVNLTRIPYTQCKQDDIRLLSIQRTDNQATVVPPTFKISTDTNYQNKNPNSQETINKGLQIVNNISFEPDEIKKFDVSVKFPGEYSFTIQQDNSFSCDKNPDKRTIDITPNHKQNHDVLFVRGEDSTSFDYDYVVAWEGDNIEEPIMVSEIDIGSSFNDIRLCVEKEKFATGLSQMGMAKLKVTNKSQRTLNNIKVELNVLVKNDDGELEATLDEFFDDGIFATLSENFLAYNKNHINNLDILNLPNTIDDDDIDEENVQILIKTLEFDEIDKKGDSIEINIPFISRIDKEVYIQLLIFEEAMPIYLYGDCDSAKKPINLFELVVYDSILTEMSIEGNNDLLDVDTSHKPCPDECFTTALTYKIRNIDSSSTEKQSAKTIITNDSNLIPYKFGYYEGNQLIEKNSSQILSQTSRVKKVIWDREEKSITKPLSYALVYGDIEFPNHTKTTTVGRTNQNGEVTFFIDIPMDIKRKYTINQLLKDVLVFKYYGNTEHRHSVLLIDPDNNLIRTYQSEDDKNPVIFDYQQTYKRYQAGDIVSLTLSLSYVETSLSNDIIFYPNIQEPGSNDELIVYYEVCNLQKEVYDLNTGNPNIFTWKCSNCNYIHRGVSAPLECPHCNEKSFYRSPVSYNQGIVKTTFKTDDYQLIENEVSKDIYLGIDTDLSSLVSIEKRVVEQNELNIIHIRLINKIKDNKEVRCLIDLGPHPEVLLGEYGVTDISMEDGDCNTYYLHTWECDNSDCKQKYHSINAPEKCDVCDGTSFHQVYLWKCENCETIHHSFESPTECSHCHRTTTATNDDEKTSFSQVDNEKRTLVEWLIGDMDANTESNCQIILKGKQIGLSEISISLYDYLHKGSSDINHHFGEKRCQC